MLRSRPHDVLYTRGSVDTITHGLLGATIAEAAFRKRLGGRSVLFGAALAMAPDPRLPRLD